MKGVDPVNRDLTVGKPSQVLVRFSLPLLGSIVFQQLYNLAGSFVAGKFLGDAALAAVGNAYEVTLIYLAFAFGCNVGCNVVLSLLFGAREYGDLRTAVNTTFIASGVLCLTLMLLGFLLTPTLLVAINTPPELMADTETYLYIYTGGLLFLFFYNIATGIFSAMGDSRTPFLFLMVSSLSNIGVDILFVTVGGMGVDGVAWATFLCQGISCLCAMAAVMRRLKRLPHSPHKLFSFHLLEKIGLIAIPSILQQSFVSVGNIFVQGIVNSFGTTTIAAYAAAVKVNNFAVTSLNTLGNAMSTYTAQNIGAGKTQRVKDGGRAGMAIGLSISAALAVLYVLLRSVLVGVFLEVPAGATLEEGMRFLLIVSPFFPVLAIKLVSDGVLRGAGVMRYFMISTFTDLVLRVVLAKIFSDAMGSSTGIWLAWPVGWIVATVISSTFYFKGVWNREQATEQANAPLS